MKKTTIMAGFMAALANTRALAEPRFPPPDFETGYTQPVLTFQEHATGFMQYLDAALLAIALVLAAWLLHKKRSRVGIFSLGFACLLYFGFYKNGCVCSIGAIQNVTLAIVDSAIPVSVPAIAVFLLPLVFALLYGRVFCGSVCPLGAIQDIVLFRPMRVNRRLEGALGLIRFFYLGLTIFFVIVFGRFIICEYDPFVSFFRLSGPFWRFVLGAAFLIVGVFIARPYCRYFCPYGALLSLLSRNAKVGVSITPDACINCTLCDPACPFEAIDRPAESVSATPAMRLFIIVSAVILLPGLSAVGYYAIGNSIAGLLLGLWFGIVIAAKLLASARVGKREYWEVNQAECLSCGRCYKYCPYDIKNGGQRDAE
jgi:NosR/NirI family transcriptional regulator, nitrous oxide reductase regulator